MFNYVNLGTYFEGNKLLSEKPENKTSKSKVIIITGTPGVGKSSVSNLLASRTDSILVSISDLVKNENLYSGTDRRRDSLIADMDKLSKRIAEIVSQANRQVIAEGHYAVDVVPPEQVKIVFVLRRDPYELRTIYEQREYKKEKILENLAAEVLDVCLYDAIKRYGVDKVCEIDTTGKKPEDVVEEIINILDKKKNCRVGLVDWLGKLEYDGKLEEYLEYF